MDDVLAKFLPYLRTAIKQAENDPTGKYGIRSVETTNPSKVLDNSIINNYNRWTSGQTPAPWIEERPAKFIDFMQRRWAPVGAENDPDNLNQNWAPNVRKFLQMLSDPALYEYWKSLNLVKMPVEPAVKSNII